MYETVSVKDKVVLITGASAGIGEATAHRMAEGGAKVILIARRIAKLEDIKKNLEDMYGAKVHVARFDVKDLDKVSAPSHPTPSPSLPLFVAAPRVPLD